MWLAVLSICLIFVRSTMSGIIQLAPSVSAEPQSPVLEIQRQLTKDDLHILLQLVSLVKKMGGVSALETLLINSARNNYRSPVFSDHRRTFISDMYGPTVTEVTVTSPPLVLQKAPTPVYLTNFTINIQKLNIDPYSLKEQD